MTQQYNLGSVHWSLNTQLLHRLKWDDNSCLGNAQWECCDDCKREHLKVHRVLWGKDIQQVQYRNIYKCLPSTSLFLRRSLKFTLLIYLLFLNWEGNILYFCNHVKHYWFCEIASKASCHTGFLIRLCDFLLLTHGNNLLRLNTFHSRQVIEAAVTEGFSKAWGNQNQIRSKGLHASYRVWKPPA